MIAAKVALTVFVVGGVMQGVVKSFFQYPNLLPGILWVDVVSAAACAAVLTLVWGAK